MSAGLLGEIRMFAGIFEPPGWLFCDGRLLTITQHPELFSVLGARFGGDGLGTFRLPDLRGRAPIGAGAATGLTARTVGQVVGAEGERLEVAHLPPHDHPAYVSSAPGDSHDPEGRYLARPTLPDDTSLRSFRWSTDRRTLHSDTIGNTGGGQHHSNMQPSLVIAFIICVDGNLPGDPARAGQIELPE